MLVSNIAHRIHTWGVALHRIPIASTHLRRSYISTDNDHQTLTAQSLHISFCILGMCFESRIQMDLDDQQLPSIQAQNTSEACRPSRKILFSELSSKSLEVFALHLVKMNTPLSILRRYCRGSSHPLAMGLIHRFDPSQMLRLIAVALQGLQMTEAFLYSFLLSQRRV